MQLPTTFQWGHGRTITLSFLLFILIFSAFHTSKNSISWKNDSENLRLVCYYNFPTGNDLQPEQIDPNLCTHIIVSFLNINETLKLDVAEDEIRILENVVKLKLRNINLRVMISVGGAGNVENWSGMVSNHTNRKTFIKSVRMFLKKYHLDGIDLDWEYPNSLGVNNLERLHFTQLLEEFRMSINRYKFKFLVSVAVPTVEFQIENSYQINYLNTFADFINVMCYDYHFYSGSTPFTGLNSPLFQTDADIGIFFSTRNINSSLKYYTGEFMDKLKINVGLPVYGHSFTLFNRHNNKLYSPAKSFGEVGSNGFAVYTEILQFLKEENVVKLFDFQAKSPYAFKNFEWVSYDDENSLKLKVEYAKKNNYGGVMIYNLNSDDFKGIYGVNFTLIRTVKKYL